VVAARSSRDAAPSKRAATAAAREFRAGEARLLHRQPAADRLAAAEGIEHADGGSA